MPVAVRTGALAARSPWSVQEEAVPEAVILPNPASSDATVARLEAEIIRHIWLGLLMARAGHDGRAELARRHEPLFHLTMLAMARVPRRFSRTFGAGRAGREP